MMKCEVHMYLGDVQSLRTSALSSYWFIIKGAYWIK